MPACPSFSYINARSSGFPRDQLPPLEASEATSCLGGFALRLLGRFAGSATGKGVGLVAIVVRLPAFTPPDVCSDRLVVCSSSRRWTFGRDGRGSPTALLSVVEVILAAGGDVI